MQMLYFLPVLFQEENVLVMKVAVAIDSFKGGLSSIEAGCAVADGRNVCRRVPYRPLTCDTIA